MKKIQTIVACAVALVLAGVTNLKSAEGGKTNTKATVRSVHGQVNYQEASGSWVPLKINDELDAGVKIRTIGADAYTDLSVNGVSSAVRITGDAAWPYPKSDRIGTTRDADTETTLDLTTGSILGNVKKISANSHYEIKTPHGVAGVRGTNVQVTVTPAGVSTFTSIQGQLLVSAVIDNLPVLKTLHDGESWTPGMGDVHPAPLDFLQSCHLILVTLGNENQPAPTGPTAPPPSPAPYLHRPDRRMALKADRVVVVARSRRMPGQR